MTARLPITSQINALEIAREKIRGNSVGGMRQAERDFLDNQLKSVLGTLNFCADNMAASKNSSPARKANKVANDETIQVTNNAVIRYLERIAGVDVERLRRGIRRKVKHAVSSDASSITIDGFEYRIEGNRVVTIVPADDSHEPAAAFDKLPKRRAVKKAAD